MKVNQFVFALITAVFVTNAFAAKPPPKPAGDVDCAGCVGTTDIEDEAVTAEKLSTGVQDEINQLKDRVGELESKINTLEEQPKPELAYDGNGTLIGTFLSTNDFFNSFQIRNKSGYLLSIRQLDGTLAFHPSAVRYESIDCSTQPYSRFTTAGGVVTNDGSDVYYVPLDAELATNLTLVSIGSPSNCSSQIQPSPASAWPVLPNDPNVTGVLSAQYPAPIRILPQ